MLSDDNKYVILKELIYLAKFAFCADFLMIIISVIIGAFTTSFGISVFLSTGYCLFNFYLVGLSAVKSIEKGKNKASGYMSLGYGIRYSLTAVYFILTMVLFELNPIGIIIPIFYAKFAYVAKAIYQTIRRDKSERSRNTF